MNIVGYILLMFLAAGMGYYYAHLTAQVGSEFGDKGMRRFVTWMGIIGTLPVVALMIFSICLSGTLWMYSLHIGIFAVGYVLSSRKAFVQITAAIQQLLYYAPMIQELLVDEFGLIDVSKDGLISALDIEESITYYERLDQVDNVLYLQCLLKHIDVLGHVRNWDQALMYYESNSPHLNYGVLEHVISRAEAEQLVDCVNRRFRKWREGDVRGYAGLLV